MHDVLRKGLLDQPCMAEDENALVVDLVMASLYVNSTGVSRSGRPIITFTTPPYLPSREVLEKWIKVYIPQLSFSDADSELKFLSLISCLSPLPRGIQLMVQCMSDIFTMPISMDASKVRFLFVETIQLLSEHYIALKNKKIDPLYARALLFGNELKLDPCVMNLIADGFFTNAIHAVMPDTTIVPQTSIVAMSLLSSDEYYFSEEIRTTVDSLLLRYLGDANEQKKNSGRPLEIVINGLINARLAVQCDIYLSTRIEQIYTLSSLFHLKLKSLKGKVTSNLLNSMTMPFTIGCGIYNTMAISSSYSECALLPRHHRFFQLN